MKKGIVFLMVLFVLQSSIKAQLQTGENTAVAVTDAGKVRGYIHNSIFTYKGIPYAQAKRFEAPQKPAPWPGVRSSLVYGPVAPLLDPTTAVQDESEFVFDHDWGYTNEDCQRVNVWTPGIDDGKKRPVMFWIHGGGFTAGSSQELPSYDGENLAKKGDVVVVSINHRLNVLGFLDMSAYGDKYQHSANVSMMDIVFALQWVKNNIKNFGGDPNNVTIFGQSGGGAKVNTLMAMPAAKGLFAKAINESGSFKTNMLDKTTTQAITAEVLKTLNLQPNQADSLQNIPFSELANAGKKALMVVAQNMKAVGKTMPPFGLSWGPALDGTDIPYQIFSPEAMELSKNIPLLIGTVKNEFFPSLFGGMNNPQLPTVMDYIKKQWGAKADAYIAAVKTAYPNDTKPSDLIDVDIIFRPGAVEQAKIKSALQSAPVYMYLFTWQSPIMDGKYKAMHCMEIAFAFNNIKRCENMTGATKEAYALAEKVSDAWLAFAKTGNPNVKSLPAWPAFNAATTATMHLNNTCVVKPQLDKALFELVAGK